MINPPPWMKTKTGSFDVDVVPSGTAILTFRQSRSDCGRSFLGSVCWIAPSSRSHPNDGDTAVGLSNSLSVYCRVVSRLVQLPVFCGVQDTVVFACIDDFSVGKSVLQSGVFDTKILHHSIVVFSTDLAE